MTPAVADILAGKARAVARAATLIENGGTEAWALLRELFPHAGRARVLGITGAPGAGKSTLTAGLTGVLRAAGERVAVIAVDPSSPFTGGAILGDRIRMLAHHRDEGVFVRSMATRGAVGGLARTTADLALLLDAAGFPWVLIETVGVGQDEVDVARVADATLVVTIPNAGDDIQAIKAGLLETADVFVVNKADLDGADRLAEELAAMLSLQPPGAAVPPICRTVASEGRGVNELLEQVRALMERGHGRRRSASYWMLRLRELYAQRLLERLDLRELEEAAEAVVARRRDPYSIVEEWLS